MCTHYCESSRSLEGDHGSYRVTFANYAHIIVSLLEAWNVTMVARDEVGRCHLLRRSTPLLVLSIKKILNSASKVANWIIVDILNYLY